MVRNGMQMQGVGCQRDSVSLRAWVIWGLAAAFFFCDYFARVSIGVMVADLMAEFNMSAARLGAVSTYFYLPYVVMQIPVGVLVDRYGVRVMLITMSILTGLACSLFGFAEHVWTLEVARFLLGFGSAFAFVSALKLAAEWFPASWLGLLAGLTQALGMIGAAVGGYPIAVSLAAVGWRYTMHVMAVVFVILCGFITYFVYDKSTERQAHSDEHAFVHMAKNLWIVLVNPQSWVNALYAGFLFAPTGALAEFWGPSYLQHVRHMSPDMAAWANSMIFIGWAIGGPLMGWLSDKLQKRKSAMLASAAASLVILSAVLYVPNLSNVDILLLLLLFGVANNGVAIAYAVASEINPRRVAGASIAFANMMSVIVGTLLLPIIGWLLDLQRAQVMIEGQISFDPNAFQTTMLCLPLCLVLGLVTAFFLKETGCLPLESKANAI
jgi:MFS family permease